MNEKQYLRFNLCLYWAYFAIFGFIQKMNESIYMVLIWAGIPLCLTILFLFLFFKDQAKLKTVTYEIKQKYYISLIFVWIIIPITIFNIVPTTSMTFMLWLVFPIVMVFLNLIGFLKHKKQSLA